MVEVEPVICSKELELGVVGVVKISRVEEIAGALEIVGVIEIAGVV